MNSINTVNYRFVADPSSGTRTSRTFLQPRETSRRFNVVRHAQPWINPASLGAASIEQNKVQASVQQRWLDVEKTKVQKVFDDTVHSLSQDMLQANKASLTHKHELVNVTQMVRDLEELGLSEEAVLAAVRKAVMHSREANTSRPAAPDASEKPAGLYLGDRFLAGLVAGAVLASIMLSLVVRPAMYDQYISDSSMELTEVNSFLALNADVPLADPYGFVP
jgi:hypothetical protein